MKFQETMIHEKLNLSLKTATDKLKLKNKLLVMIMNLPKKLLLVLHHKVLVHYTGTKKGTQTL